jgi:glycolate oxidase FAD binding subunit
MESALAALREDGATLLAYPGLGLIYSVTRQAPGDPAATGRQAQRAAEVARAAGGSVVLEQAPVDARRELDVFGGAEALLPLHRSLKSRFDPAGILNPGRFMGHL